MTTSGIIADKLWNLCNILKTNPPAHCWNKRMREMNG